MSVPLAPRWEEVLQLYDPAKNVGVPVSKLQNRCHSKVWHREMKTTTAEGASHAAQLVVARFRVVYAANIAAEKAAKKLRS